ncbi:MAG: SPOR domain-containing protein [Terriglobia bacterium]
MGSRLEQAAGPRGLSVRQLTLIFVGAVGVSALFFALGFLVGNNRHVASAAPAVEQVSPPSEIPPTVNPPLQNSPAAASPSAVPFSKANSPIVEQNLKSTPGGKLPASSPAPAPAAAPPQPAQAPPRARDASVGLMLQIAALHTRREALSLERRLRRRGFPAVLLTPQEAGMHDRMYRVQAGPFSSRSKALAAQKKLRRAGFKSFIKQSG